MKKCDFCTKSTASGKCFTTFSAEREQYCEKAIELMVKALGEKGGVQG